MRLIQIYYDVATSTRTARSLKNTCAADNILTALRHLSAVFKLFIVMRVFVLQFTYTLTKKVDFVSYPVIVLFYTCVG